MGCLGWLSESAHGRPDPGIKYIENKNQWPDEVDFSARIPGGRMSIQPGRFVYDFIDEGRIEELTADGTLFVRVSQHDQRRIPISSVALIDRVGGASGLPDTELREAAGPEHLLLLAGGNSVKGRLIAIS